MERSIKRQDGEGVFRGGKKKKVICQQVDNKHDLTVKYHFNPKGEGLYLIHLVTALDLDQNKCGVDIGRK